MFDTLATQKTLIHYTTTTQKYAICCVKNAYKHYLHHNIIAPVIKHNKKTPIELAANIIPHLKPFILSLGKNLGITHDVINNIIPTTLHTVCIVHNSFVVIFYILLD